VFALVVFGFVVFGAFDVFGDVAVLVFAAWPCDVPVTCVFDGLVACGFDVPVGCGFDVPVACGFDVPVACGCGACET